MYFQVLAAGFLGGAIRGLVGFIKHQYSYKNVKFDLYYFLAMASLSGIIGLVSVAVAQELGLVLVNVRVGPAMALVIGYAGGDFIENLYKLLMKKASLYPSKDE